ncbi:uncharacterized protein [Amphiura filiformis]|uniref:uncharacterized protein n=1 Tax=Amphiura filiformis TaxID=82378 RepID=UPI003B20E5A9
MAMIVLFLALLGLTNGLNINIGRRCDKINPKVDLSDTFSENIAHAIHSMTVQGLRLFNPKVTEKNSVPTVNHNMSAPDLVVPYAPDEPIGDDFNTDAMNMIDHILSHIGKENDALGAYWSPIGRVAHAFHMWDLWYRVHEEFECTIRDNPPKQDVCDCLMDTEHNGIRAAVQWVGEHYKSGSPVAIPKLTDADSWQVWKDRVLNYFHEFDNNAAHDAALYLYCATKDF